MHNGYENTYVVQQGKVKYKLYPLVRSHKESILMCFGRDVPVQDQDTPHYDTRWKQCQIEGHENPRVAGLVEQPFVLVGAMKFPLRGQADEGDMVIEQRQIKNFQQSNVQPQYFQVRGQSNPNIFVSKPWCVTAGTRMEQITLGNNFTPQQQQQLGAKNNGSQVNSWGKSFFHGGEYGAGAPQIFKPQLKIIKTTKIFKTNQKEGMYKQGHQINWAVLEPIMMLK